MNSKMRDFENDQEKEQQIKVNIAKEYLKKQSLPFENNMDGKLLYQLSLKHKCTLKIEKTQIKLKLF